MPVHVYEEPDGGFLMTRDDGRVAPQPSGSWRFARSQRGRPPGWRTSDAAAARRIATQSGVEIEPMPASGGTASP